MEKFVCFDIDHGTNDVFAMAWLAYFPCMQSWNMLADHNVHWKSFISQMMKSISLFNAHNEFTESAN